MLSDTTDLIFTDTGLTPETDYTYSLVATNTVGSSTASEVIATTLATPTVPAAPSLEKGVVTDTTVALSWTAVTGADTYTLSRTGGAGPAVTVLSDTTDLIFTDTGLTPETDYTYSLVATNTVGSSTASEVIATTLATPTVPATPTLVVASTTDTAAVLTWDAVSGADTYTLTRTLGSGSAEPVLSDTTALTATDTGLTAATDYTYSLTATNTVGTSAASEITARTADGPTTPATPTLALGTTSSDSIILSWATVTGAESYTLTRVGTGGASDVEVFSGDALTATDRGLTADTEYKYTITATNTAGTSAPSVEFAARTAILPLPPTLRAGAGAATPTTITLEWDAVTGADSYVIYGDSAGTSVIAHAGAGISVTVTELSPATGYTFYARSFDAGGNPSSLSAGVSARTAVAPPIPAAPVLTPGTTTQNTIAFSWAAVTGAESYTLTRVGTGGASDVVVASEITELIATDRGLTADTEYKYTLTATNAGGTSGSSNEVTARTNAIPDTEKPVIAVSGSSETIERTATNTYTEQGATVTDDDGAYSETVAVTGDTPDTSVVGVYTVTYTAPSDAAGNTPDPQSIVITVRDTTKPVITVDPLAVTLPAGSAAPDILEGVTTDDGSLIFTLGAVNIGTSGSYTITYDSTDASHNDASSVTRTYTVISTIIRANVDGDEVTIIFVSTSPGSFTLAPDGGASFDFDIEAGVSIKTIPIQVGYDYTGDIVISIAGGAEVARVPVMTGPPDTTAPPVPAITTSLATVNTASFMIAGTAEIGTTVALLKGGTPTGATVTAADGTGAFSFTVTLTEGANSFTATAFDGVNTSAASSPVVITLDTATPDAPAITTQTATVNTASFTIEGTAEAGATVELFNGATSAGTTTADSGAFSFTVTLTEGENSFTATASDGSNTSAASSPVVITLTHATTAPSPRPTDPTPEPDPEPEPNTAPVADAGAPPIAAEGATVTLNGRGSSDPDDDTLTYAWRQTGGTSVSLSGANTATPGFTAPSLLSADAELVFRLTVSDGSLSATDTVTVTVTHVNDAPGADAGEPQTVAEGATVTLRGTGTDPDGDDAALRYAWSQTDTGAPRVSLSGADTATSGFTAPSLLSADAELVFRLTVSDGAVSATDTVTITVTRPRDTVAPVITLLGDSPLEVNQGATYTDPGATASDDTDGDLSARIVVGGDTVDTDTIGAYNVTYDVSDAAGNAAATVTRIVRVVVVRDLAALNEAILPEVARDIADRNVSAIARRIEQARLPSRVGSSASLGGASSLAEIATSQGSTVADGRFDLKRLLNNSNFVLPLSATGAGAADGTQLTLWGAGDYRDLKGADGVRWSGDLFSLQLGLDAHLNERTILGVSVSKSQVELDYTNPGPAAGGNYDLDMTSVHPYLGWTAGGLDFWATLGYGEGELEISADGAQTDIPSSDLSMQTLGLGANGVLMATGTTTLLLKTEILSTQLEVDASEGITAITQQAHRMRMTLEAIRGFSLDSGARLETSLEAGLRYDGGDGETGAGAELGGGLRYANLGGGLVIEGKARALVGGKGDTEEWGLSGLITYNPAANGRGLSFSLTPGYGVTTSGVERLWQQGLDDGLEAQGGTDGNNYTPNLDLRLDYGMDVSAMPGLVTPYSEFSFGATGDTYRLGLQWQRSKWFDLKLVAEREAGQITADHRIYLEGEIVF